MSRKKKCIISIVAIVLILGIAFGILMIFEPQLFSLGEHSSRIWSVAQLEKGLKDTERYSGIDLKRLFDNTSLKVVVGREPRSMYFITDKPVIVCWTAPEQVKWIITSKLYTQLPSEINRGFTFEPSCHIRVRRLAEEDKKDIATVVKRDFEEIALGDPTAEIPGEELTMYASSEIHYKNMSVVIAFQAFNMLSSDKEVLKSFFNTIVDEIAKNLGTMDIKT